MDIARGKINGAKKVLVYGPEGIGKTTFAAAFPDPVFIDTEGSTKEQDVARLPEPSSWTMIKEEVRYVAQHPDVCRTLVIDTADWAEKMAIQSVLDEHNKSGIEDFGYGNGYRYVFEKFGELLNLLNDVIAAGVNVVLTAHATLRKFEQPDELGAYDRYTMKLIDSPKTSISAAVKEWADMVLFANYKTIVVTDSKTKKAKAQGGARVMYTSHHSCWDAKNRYGLPEELPFSYEGIRTVIESAPIADKARKPAESVRKQPECDQKTAESAQKPSENVRKTADAKPKIEPAPTPLPPAMKAAAEAMNTPPSQPDPPRIGEDDLDKRIPKALRDLMLKDNIGEWDIENFASKKGFVPYDTKIWDYETVNPGIIHGLFVAQWTKVRDQIHQMNKDTYREIPFAEIPFT